MIRSPLQIVFLSIVLLALAGASLAASFSGRVVKVTDGDTIQVLHGRVAEKIRLAGIDAPEKAQPFGTKAKAFAAEQVAGKVVSVEVTGKDRYGRTIGEVFLEGGKSLNRELVRAGFAWWYRRYSSDASLGRLEDEARSARKGLWADPHPIPSWQWRKGVRSQQEPSGASRGVLHGNVESLIFHRQSCRYFDCASCTSAFETGEEAISAGFRACKVCGGR